MYGIMEKNSNGHNKLYSFFNNRNIRNICFIFTAKNNKKIKENGEKPKMPNNECIRLGRHCKGCEHIKIIDNPPFLKCGKEKNNNRGG